MDKSPRSYPACVGLTYIGSGWAKGSRSEVWNDMVSRPWPLHLRFLPPSWVSFDRDGARLFILHKERIQQWLDKKKLKKKSNR